MKRFVAVLFLSFLCTANARAAVHTENFEYKQGETSFQGYLAYEDSSTGKKPGVLVIHEFSGLGDYAKKRAEQLAAMGNVALAADMYGKDIKPNSHDAEIQGELGQKDRSDTRARIVSAFEALRTYSKVDPSRIAVIGYCTGGAAVLELARSGADVKGFVTFHGAVNASAEEDKNIKGKILILHGTKDPFVPPWAVRELDNELNGLGIPHEVRWYENAKHSFTVPSAGTDPSNGSVYDPVADKQSWEDMTHFFDEIFK